MALTSKELLQEQLEAAAKSSRKQPKGISVPETAGITYLAELRRIIKAIKRDIDLQLMPVIKGIAPEFVADSVPTTDAWIDDIARIMNEISRKWYGIDIDSIAKGIAASFVSTTNRSIRDRFNRDMSGFGIDVFGDDPAIDDYVSAAIYDNVQLIKSIPQQYLDRVQQSVITNARAGLRPSVIQSQLLKQYDITVNRARMIARDQTAKAAGDLASMRQQASGFEYFRWKTADDSRVRDRHEDIANTVTEYGKGVYRWDQLPKSDDGRPIKPGSDYQCRCIAIPVSKSKVELFKKTGAMK